jgi:hypothetical protein
VVEPRRKAARGFFIEWQGKHLDLAGYMYDDAGNPVWYLAVYATPNLGIFTRQLWDRTPTASTLTGTYPSRDAHQRLVRSVAIRFNSLEHRDDDAAGRGQSRAATP